MGGLLSRRYVGLLCLIRHQTKKILPRKEWTKSPIQKRRAHVELLLESLEHKDVEIRFTNARRLLYILQGDCASAAGYIAYTHVVGTFAETTSPEHQLHWIFENCKVVRDANGLSNIVEAMKIASSKHDLLGSVPISCNRLVWSDLGLDLFQILMLPAYSSALMKSLI